MNLLDLILELLLDCAPPLGFAQLLYSLKQLCNFLILLIEELALLLILLRCFLKTLQHLLLHLANIALLLLQDQGGITINGHAYDLVALGDLVDDIHILLPQNHSKHRIFPIQMRCWDMCDKELAAVRAWAGIGH